MTSETDYLGFGSVIRAMLQEPTKPEGPRVPWSIQSTQHFDTFGTTTLMRMCHHHESRSSQISEAGGHVDVRPQMSMPGLVALASNCVSINMPG